MLCLFKTLCNNAQLELLFTLKEQQLLMTLVIVEIQDVRSLLQEACAHAKRLQTVNPYFNVFVGDVGKWCPFDPDTSSKEAGNPEYANEELHKMMRAYLENQEKAKTFLQNIMSNKYRFIVSSIDKIKVSKNPPTTVK